MITKVERKFQDINLAQVGFEHRVHLPFLPLLVKSLYTIMFWVTLRQLMQERKERKQNTAMADMVAPLQVTVGTATTGNLICQYVFRIIFVCILSLYKIMVVVPEESRPVGRPGPVVHNPVGPPVK